MGMGLPAVTVSGFAVANVILRELKKKTYKDNVEDKFVTSIDSKAKYDIPPNIDNNPENAKKIARLCQHCEDAPCMAACPAQIDIPNFMRRIEAGNFDGAARIIREKNPMAEICGYICSPASLCEKACYRKRFTEKSMPIQEMHRWVSSYTGSNGWPGYYSKLNGKRIAIIGTGPVSLTSAYFLARMGFEIDCYEKGDEVGGKLLKLIGMGNLDKNVFENEIKPMLSKRINFFFNWELNDKKKLIELTKNYDRVYITIQLEIDLEEFKDKLVILEELKSSNYDDYDIVRSVRDGRIMAQKISNL
jgi:glutamate synthase (NADPH/NADH) small chain